VTTATDQAVARLAADTAFEQAMAQTLGSVMAYTNPFALDLIVSTNYIRPGGFISGNRSLTNVSFATPNGQPLAGNDVLQNLLNLYYNPRVPVYMTNRTARSNEFRSTTI
jgi:hypothetical protein